jgi:hypothetical protein
MADIDYTDLSQYEPRYDNPKLTCNDIILERQNKVNIIVKRTNSLGDVEGGYIFFEHKYFMINFDPEKYNNILFPTHQKDLISYVKSRMKSYKEFANLDIAYKSIKINNEIVNDIKFFKDYYEIDSLQRPYSSKLMVEIIIE